MNSLPSAYVRLFWAGVAALAGLGMISFSPRIPRDPFPLAATLCLAAGLVLRLRTGPFLFFGTWIFGELRPLLPNPQGHRWEGLPGSPEAGSLLVLAAVTVVYLFAACHYQFLSAGVHLTRRERFEPTLAEASPRGPLARMLVALAVRAIALVCAVAFFQAGADWASQTGPGYTLGRSARTGAVVWEAALMFFGVAVVSDLLRFLLQERTAAACYVNDYLWSAHRKVWAAVDRRTT